MSELTERQETVLAFLPLFPAALSVISSSVLLWMTLQSGLRSPYRRFLFALSLFDIVNSIRIALGPFLVPSAAGDPLAFGNQATCTLLGALTQLTFPAQTYYSALMMYFLLRVRYQVSDKKFTETYEVWIHSIALGHAVITMVAGLSLDLFGRVSFGGSCWVAPNLQIGCGKKCVVTLQWIFGGIPFLGTFLVSLVTNALIAQHAWATRKKSDPSSMQHSRGGGRKDTKLRLVLSQAALYVCVFYLTHICTLSIRIMAMAGRDTSDEGKLFPLFVVRSIFHPLMGFGNLLVYVRPRYSQLRSHHSGESRLWALRKLVFEGMNNSHPHGSGSPSSFRLPKAKSSNGYYSWLCCLPGRKSLSERRRQERRMAAANADSERAGEFSASHQDGFDVVSDTEEKENIMETTQEFVGPSPDTSQALVRPF